MKRVERLAYVTVAGVICNLMVWMSMEGCSGDTTGDAGDSGPDQTTDVGPDVAPDVTPDVAPDVGPDVISDAGPDVTEIIAFQQAYAAALCQRIGVCCYGAQLDASAPPAAVAACEAYAVSSKGGGFENAIGDLANNAALHSGNIAVNESAKASCLAGLATLSCPSITGTEYATVAQNCLGALTGTVPVGGGCHETVECNDGYCQANDGGAVDASAPGTCVALAGLGQPCNPIGNGNDQCMYRSWVGTTPLRCDIMETEAGTCNSFGTPTYTCTAKTGAGGGCFFEWECASEMCNDTCQCGTSGQSWTVIPSGFCPEYFGADSGLN